MRKAAKKQPALISVHGVRRSADWAVIFFSAAALHHNGNKIFLTHTVDHKLHRISGVQQLHRRPIVVSIFDLLAVNLHQHIPRTDSGKIGAAVQRGLRVVLNVSPISEEILRVDLSGVDWLVVNEIECARMAGCEDPQEGYETLKQRYPELGILLTLGSAGSVSWKDGVELRQCAYPVKAVDTTGAGDTYMGYFVGCLAQGMDRQTAMQYASMASAISVTRPGAAVSIPTMDEVRAAVEAL